MRRPRAPHCVLVWDGAAQRQLVRLARKEARQPVAHLPEGDAAIEIIAPVAILWASRVRLGLSRSIACSADAVLAARQCVVIARCCRAEKVLPGIKGRRRPRCG
ncbi:hypothetical protein SLT36_22505 [Aminobacter sp. BA135]|uniref:hypothetical protein n=1 Tax=Aminobacter sp. BA135 TaxID=537596 RepID=UPI003D78E409